jgi:hypothetical protein
VHQVDAAAIRIDHALDRLHLAGRIGLLERHVRPLFASGARTCLVEHLGGEVDAEEQPGRANRALKQSEVGSVATAQLDDRIAGSRPERLDFAAAVRVEAITENAIETRGHVVVGGEFSVKLLERIIAQGLVAHRFTRPAARRPPCPWRRRT